MCSFNSVLVYQFDITVLDINYQLSAKLRVKMIYKDILKCCIKKY